MNRMTHSYQQYQHSINSNISKPVNNSGSTYAFFKHACHANLGAEGKLALTILHILVHMLQKL